MLVQVSTAKHPPPSLTQRAFWHARPGLRVFVHFCWDLEEACSPQAPQRPAANPGRRVFRAFLLGPGRGRCPRGRSAACGQSRSEGFPGIYAGTWMERVHEGCSDGPRRWHSLAKAREIGELERKGKVKGKDKGREGKERKGQGQGQGRCDK